MRGVVLGIGRDNGDIMSGKVIRENINRIGEKFRFLKI